MKLAACLILGLLAICATDASVQGLTRLLAGHPAPKLTNPRIQPIRPLQRKAIRPLTRPEELRPGGNTLVKTKDSCPEGYVRFKDTCFSPSLTPKTWTSARLACMRSAHGGDLASIHSKEEVQFIQKKFGAGQNGLLWTGLRKERPETPYTWSNGDTVRYLPWASNYTGQEPFGYAALSLTNLNFHPRTSRSEMLPFLCGTRNVSGSSSAGVNQPAGNDMAGGNVNSGGDNSGMMFYCREGWEAFEGKCYKAFDEKMTYQDACLKCKRQGANVLSLHSPRESEFVRQNVMINKRPNEKYWLGLSNGENGLEWSDGSPFDYSHWPPELTIVVPEPQVVPGTKEDQEARRMLENCFAIHTDQAVWDYQQCDEEVCYIACEDGGDFISGPTTRIVNSTMMPTTKRPRWGARAQSESEGEDSDQSTVTLLLVVVGCVVVMVAVFGAISWRSQYGRFPFPWTSLQDSPRDEDSHNLQRVNQWLRDSGTSDVSQGTYGATE